MLSDFSLNWYKTQLNLWMYYIYSVLTIQCNKHIWTGREKLDSLLTMQGNRSFLYEVISIKVVSIRCQAIKLHKTFFDFLKYSCTRARKTFEVNIPRSFSQVRETCYISSESTCIKATGNLMQLPFSVFHIKMYITWGRQISVEEKSLCCIICKNFSTTLRWMKFPFRKRSLPF